MMKAVTFKNVSEQYRIKFIVDGVESWQDFWALNDITFSVEQGQTLAIVGENGAGKSTILKLIARLLKADKGDVFVKGRVTALLELGAGFDPELTGKENLYLSSSLFGLSKRITNGMVNKIVEFSGLGKFIDAQVKSYSQGMFVRLAFSVAINMNPDILLIDDSLSVGDEDFQKKCIYEILRLKQEGKTIIFVTHNLSLARRLCSKGIFLRKGEIIKEGHIDAVISYYMETLGDREGIAIIRKDPLGAVFNNGRLIIRWKDKTITQDQGGYSSFFFCGQRFNSTAANWRVEIKNGRHIVAQGEWFDIPVTQNWSIKLLDDGLLEVKVALKIRDKSSIKDFQAELLFTKEYNYWFSSEHEGIFPRDFLNGRECELVYHDPFDKLACLKQNEKEKLTGLLPSVIVDAFKQGTDIVCQILNSGTDINSRIIRLKSPVVYEADRDNEASLTMEIKFIEAGRDDALEECLEVFRQLVKKEKQKIEKKQMELQLKKFLFGNSQFSLCIDENNFLHMYYADKKITSGFGIRTSLLIGKEWKDTYSKQMWIKKISENHIQIQNILWIDVPATQTWSFLMKEEGVIEVVMEMDVQFQINIHEMHVTIFLSKDYAKWFTRNESGNFGENIKAEGEIALKDENTKVGGVVSACLPTLVLDLSRDLKYLLRIWSFDPAFSSPFVEAVTEDIECREGKAKFFTGIIRIGEDRDSIKEKTLELLEPEEENIEDIFDKEDPYDNSLYLADGQQIIQQADISSAESQNGLDEIRRNYVLGKTGIAVTRFNFFKLDKILKFYAGILNREIDLDNCTFNPFPVKTIFSNFIDYLKQIKTVTQGLGVRLILKDKDLFNILKTVSAQATAYNGRQLLRHLGVVCEHVFIGPRIIVFDLCHRCNANCIHCWFHNPKTLLCDEYLDMQLDFELYKKIVDDAQKLYVELIIFDGNGEPLLDKRFSKMAKYAKDKGIMISFSTNGILFNQDMAKKTLSDFNVETITCSLPAATEETYAAVNPKQSGVTFHEVVQNMTDFIKLRNNAGLKKPFLKMNHVIHRLNFHELMKMAELDARIGADIVQFCIMQKPDKNIIHLELSLEQINLIRDSLGAIVDFLRERNIVSDDDFIFQLEHYRKNEVVSLENSCGANSCSIGWFQALIFANAEVSMCQLKVVGNLKNASLKDIWDSDKYQRYRIQAKYLKDNRDVTFMNGARLYDENCEYCAIIKKNLRIS